MVHYFEEDENLKDDFHPIEFELSGRSFKILTNSTLFSSEKLDAGTRLLIETILENEKEPESFLDLGCGSGVIGLVLSEFWPKTEFTYIDINPRACRTVSENLKHLSKEAEVFCSSSIGTDKSFACISLNPPIHTGKENIYAMFDSSLSHLQKDGSFWIVMRKQHGAASAVKYLESKGCLIERVARDKGFWILKTQIKAD